ncbi:cytochrome P450 [Dacryopinax primogenitus]|uniref:Cytochrome P450 n=1 Tax=Dacryopinax primogenitus (strain DJM 731) TaxID=1858805 RepID=M5FRL5_DACPD|nr:cytochrome P450 [Dacryopinax primogenitus]EJT98353.1 cytochrome P450 [Dacryopinax primogenitus]
MSGINLSMLKTLLVALIIAHILFGRIRSYRTARKAVGSLPVVLYPFAPFKLPGIFFPSSWWNPGLLNTWHQRGLLYLRNKSKTFAAIGWLDGNYVIFSSSFEVISQVSGPKARWDRTKKTGEIQKHRRIVGPAFNNQLNRRVWEESLAVWDEMSIEEGWEGTKTVHIPDVKTSTGKFTLSIIGRAGFGISGEADTRKVVGEDGMSLREAFRITGENPMVRTMLPSWVFRLPIQKFKEVKAAEKLLLRTMHAQIDDRRTREGSAAASERDQEGNGDIFHHLLAANAREVPEKALSDAELLSNVFILLFAGHGTRHTLPDDFGLLACHPEEQERLAAFVRETCPEDKVANMWDRMDELRPVYDCIIETLRLFPDLATAVAPVVLRRSTEDSVLQIPGLADAIPLPKGTLFVGDLIGISYDPDAYVSPHTFLPSRWAGKNLISTDLAPFGHGIHMCLGRYFAMTEMMAFLCMLLNRWEIVPVKRGGESLRDWKERVLDRNQIRHLNSSSCHAYSDFTALEDAWRSALFYLSWGRSCSS